MSESNFEDELDLNQVIQSLIRNKMVIFLLGFLGFSYGIFDAFTRERVWRGEFNIVLNDVTNSNLTSGADRFNKLFNRNALSSQILTEVEILKSPSVLLNVFEFVKQKKESQELDFKTFSKSLNINLKSGTSILDVKYDDSEKDLIIPVLEKISKNYQVYSGKKRNRNIELISDYYSNQISFYKEKSIKSEKKVDSFAIDNDLNFFKTENQEYSGEINVEKLRVETENKIRIFEEQLKKIDNLENEQEQIMYFASTIQDLKDTNLINKLKELDQKITSLKIIYKSNDKSIKDLEKERSFFIKLLTKQTKGFLKAKIYDESSKLITLQRPKEVIIKYKSLLSEANRDKLTLTSLENDFRQFSMDRALSQDPWELTTKPTLLPYPVAPSRKKIVLTGILLGLFIGFIISYLKDYISGIFYSKEAIKNYSRWRILADISIDSKEYFINSLKLLDKNINLDNKGTICLKLVGNLSRLKIDNFLKEQNIINEKTYKIEENITNILKYEKIIFLTSIGVTTKNDVNEIKKKFQMLENRIMGQIII